MTLNEYFHHIQEKIKNKDFKVLIINTPPPKDISIFLESINYLMWEWSDDHKNGRVDMFDYIIIPNNVDYDFTSIPFGDFLRFLSDEKSKEIIMVNTDDYVCV